jgi:hypothetical protein
MEKAFTAAPLCAMQAHQQRVMQAQQQDMQALVMAQLQQAQQQQ